MSYSLYNTIIILLFKIIFIVSITFLVSFFIGTRIAILKNKKPLNNKINYGKNDDYEYLARVTGVIYSTFFKDYITGDIELSKEYTGYIASDSQGLVKEEEYSFNKETGSYAVKLYKYGYFHSI